MFPEIRAALKDAFDPESVFCEHYLQVTEEHWDRAANLPPILSPTRPPIDAHSASIARNQETKKPSEKLGFDGCGGMLIPYQVTPTGVEPVLPP